MIIICDKCLGARKIRPRKIRPRKVRPRKIRPRKICPVKIRPRKIRPRNIRPLFSSTENEFIFIVHGKIVVYMKNHLLDYLYLQYRIFLLSRFLLTFKTLCLSFLCICFISFFICVVCYSVKGCYLTTYIVQWSFNFIKEFKLIRFNDDIKLYTVNVKFNSVSEFRYLDTLYRNGPFWDIFHE